MPAYVDKRLLLAFSVYVSYWEYNMSKQKGVVLSPKDKVKIIASTKMVSGMEQTYGIETYMISDIKKNSHSTIKFSCVLKEKDGSSHQGFWASRILLGFYKKECMTKLW